MDDNTCVAPNYCYCPNCHHERHGSERPEYIQDEGWDDYQDESLEELNIVLPADDWFIPHPGKFPTQWKYGYWEDGVLHEGWRGRWLSKEEIAACFFDLHLEIISVNGYEYRRQSDSWKSEEEIPF